MKYILKGDNDFKNPMETILKNRNQTFDLLDTNFSVSESYENYDNIEEAVDLYFKHINNNSNILHLVDADVDGFSSSALIYRYTKEVLGYDNISFVLHTDKQHGLSDDIVIPEGVDLVVIPDASSNDYKQHKALRDRGIDVLVLDHHHADKYSEHAIVVNNQLSNKVKNKNLSGVGVVFKFMQAIDDRLFEDKANNYLDLVALGNVADVMDLSEPETRYLCYLGIDEINNPFIEALMEISEFELENKYNFTKIGWVIAPKLNGTIRSGTMEEKTKMFEAFISDDYKFCLKIADMCKKVKARQDSGVKSAMKTLESKIVITNEDRCIMAELSSRTKQSYTGLIAGKLADKYGMPVLLYRTRKDGKTIMAGSGRGNENITPDFMKDLKNSKLFEYVEGHNNAFGHGFKISNLDKIKEYINDLYKDKTIISGKTHEVDFILNEADLTLDFVKEISDYEDEWGKGLEEPKIAIENIMIAIESDNIKGTKAKNMIFEHNGVKFIKKYLSNDLKNKVLNQGMLFVDIVGKCVKNNYNGSSYPQIEIIDIDI